MIKYVIRNNRTMAILRTSIMEYMTFHSPEGAQAYIQQQRLNPDCFDVVPMMMKSDPEAYDMAAVTNDPKKVPLKYRGVFKDA